VFLLSEVFVYTRVFEHGVYRRRYCVRCMESICDPLAVGLRVCMCVCGVCMRVLMQTPSSLMRGGVGICVTYYIIM